MLPHTHIRQARKSGTSCALRYPGFAAYTSIFASKAPLVCGGLNLYYMALISSVFVFCWNVRIILVDITLLN